MADAPPNPIVGYVSQTLQYKRQGVDQVDAAIVTRVLEDGRASLTIFGENLSDYDSPVTVFTDAADGEASGLTRYAYPVPR